MTSDNNTINEPPQQSSFSTQQSLRRPAAFSLNIQRNLIQLENEELGSGSNPRTPLTPYLRQLFFKLSSIKHRPLSGQKRNRLNVAAQQGLTLPKSHNNFNLKLTQSNKSECSTSLDDSEKSPSGQEESSFVSWQSILSSLQANDLIRQDDYTSTYNEILHNQQENAPSSVVPTTFYESPIKSFLYPNGFVSDLASSIEDSQTSQFTTFYNNRPRGSSQ